MYLMYLSIIIVFPCFFSLPYLFSKRTNKILQGNYIQEFSGRPDMTFSCKQKQSSNRFEISYSHSSYRVSCKASWVFNYSIKSLEFSGAATQQIINCVRFKQTSRNSEIARLWMVASVF